MSDSKKYYWLKLKDDFFTLTTTKLLRNMPEGDLLTIIYLKLQLLSLKNNGNLIHHRLLPNLVDELAIAIDEKSQYVELTLRTLEKLHLIESISNDEYLLTAMNELIGAETKSAIQKRTYRNKIKQIEDKKQTSIGQCPTEIEIEIEIDKEKEKIKRKKNVYKSISTQTIQKENPITSSLESIVTNSLIDFNKQEGAINGLFLTMEEHTKFIHWLEQRVIDHPKLKNTERAIKIQIERLRDATDRHSISSILGNTIRGNDNGVYEKILILGNQEKKKRPKSFADLGLTLL